jgi:alcohol dehydrogenase
MLPATAEGVQNMTDVQHSSALATGEPARADPSDDAVGFRVELRALRVRFGAGALAGLGEIVRGEGGTRALVVTDPGLEAVGHVERARESLERCGVASFVFDGVQENPGEAHVAAGVEAARACGCDFLIGLGGGSAMDCAKGVNFVLTNGGRMEDYWGMGRATRPMLPSIAVPGTAGTGSEAQSFAIISREGDHRKMACGDEKARFRWAILDPEVAATAPADVAAVTGIDAISHAVESQVSRTRNPFSQMMSREAWRRLSRSFLEVIRHRERQEAWGEMLLGAHIAGAAIEASMLGAAHALANPLTAAYDVTHGLAVAIVLPSVVRYNGEAVAADYQALLAETVSSGGAPRGPAEQVARAIETFREEASLPSRLEDLGVARSRLPELARQAADQWTAGFNPRPVGERELLELYDASF